MEIIDSLDVKQAFWFKKDKIPGTSWSISGYSRSAFRTGFYIKELNMMLDAGPQCHKYPSHILITHSHGDHIASLPFTLIREGVGANATEEEIPDPTMIYGPLKAKPFIETYIDTLFTTNAMSERAPREELDQYYQYKGKEQGDQFALKIKGADLKVEVFKCDHGVPTISYGISEHKKKLKTEYQSLPGKEIAKLRKAGTEITENILFHRFAYVCDTSIQVFDDNPNVLDYPVIFIECTFLLPEELEMASTKKHIHWFELRPFVEKYPEKIFYLFHFSQRYKDADIWEYLEKENLPNLRWWA